jgi:hypothetical protein
MTLTTVRKLDLIFTYLACTVFVFHLFFLCSQLYSPVSFSQFEISKMHSTFSFSTRSVDTFHIVRVTNPEYLSKDG